MGLTIVTKRLLTISIIIFTAFCFCSCSSGNKGDDTSDIPINITYPNNNTVNGYRLKVQSSEAKTQEMKYYANKNTKKFHTKDCTYSKKIIENNLLLSNDISSLLNDGYEACKKCNPK